MTNATATAVETVTAKRGRPAIFSTVKEIAVALKSFAAGEELSYNHKQRLIATGHIVAEKSDEPRTTRGRAKMVYKLSGKGKGLVALSKNWKTA